MVASSKFGMPSVDPHRPAYLNRQRLINVSASLEQSGSFREGAGTRIVSSLSGTSRPLSHGDPSSLFQSLLSDLKTTILGQKFPRGGEMKRSVNKIRGVSSEVSVPAASRTRILTSSALEEIKHMKNSLKESTTQASGRAKAFGEAVSKIDNHSDVFPRKCLQTQSNVSTSCLENGAQKLEKKVTSAVPNKRHRSNCIVRPFVPVDGFEHVNGGAKPPEEKGGSVRTCGDGLEKSLTKKKRSVIKSEASGTVVEGRSFERDREPKQAMQQKLTSHAHQRVDSTHGLRSNGCEDKLALVKASALGPRSSSGSLSRPLPNMHRSSGNSNDLELPKSVNKLNDPIGAMNLKRSASTCSRPTPVDWGEQRSQRKTQTRVAKRSKISSPIVTLVTSRDEISAPDIGDNVAITGDGLALTSRLSSNSSHHSKLRGGYAPSPGLSACEESVMAENKLKDKRKKCREIEERDSPTSQKVATFVQPSGQTKVGSDGDLADDIPRQGRIGRGSTSTRPGNEKPDSAPATSARIGSENIERTPGRPPTENRSERKGDALSRHSMDNTPTESAGEQGHDHEELLAAAKDALDTSNTCSSSFWKQRGPLLGILSAQDVDSLNQQMDPRSTLLPLTPTTANRDDYDTVSKGVCLDECEDGPFLEHLVRKKGAPYPVSICQALLSAIIEEEEIGRFDYANGIGEEHLCNDAHENGIDFDEELVLNVSSMNLLGTFQAPERVLFDSCKDGTNGAGRYHAELTYENLGHNKDVSLKQKQLEGCVFGEIVLDRTMECISVLSEFEYNQMGIEEKILLELSKIGLCPEPVPDLALRKEKEIVKDISMLKEKLHELLASSHPNACDSMNVNKKAAKDAAPAFARQTLARYQQFVETGSNCFGEPPLTDMFSSLPSLNHTTEVVADRETADHLASPMLPKLASTDTNSIHDSFQPLVHVQFVSSLRTTQSPGSFLSRVAKRKRSRRERHGKGRKRDTAQSEAKCERENKVNPKQKVAQVSTSFNGLLSKPAPESQEIKDGEAIDLSYLELPELNGDLREHGQMDIDSLLNIELEELQDHDFTHGLHVPMDDLSHLNLL